MSNDIIYFRGLYAFQRGDLEREDRDAYLRVISDLFRKNGVDGTDIASICRSVGLDEDRLRHFFPGGKDELVRSVLEDMYRWFDETIFEPLQNAEDAAGAIRSMFDRIETYFSDGHLNCLAASVGQSALRDRVPGLVMRHYARWIATLARCLGNARVPSPEASRYAEDAIVALQGALVIARAFDDVVLFQRAIRNQETCLLGIIAVYQPSRRGEGVVSTSKTVEFPA